LFDFKDEMLNNNLAILNFFREYLPLTLNLSNLKHFQNLGISIYKINELEDEKVFNVKKIKNYKSVYLIYI